MKPFPQMSAALLATTAPLWAASHAIVAGERIGQVRIGADLEGVTQTLGAPDQSDAAMGKSVSTWFGVGKKTRLDVFAARNFGHDQDRARVRQIRANSTVFRLASGLRVGGNLAQVKSAFPAVHAIGFYHAGGARVVLYDAAARGISFEVARRAGQSAASSRIVAIAVHRSGVAVQPEFLPVPSNFTRF